MGGNNQNDNLIKLSIEDHVIAHIILAENCEDVYKRRAWDSVVILRKGWGKNTEDIRKKLIDNNKGELNHFFGKKHTNETKKKMAESHPYPFKGKTYDEYYGKMKSKSMREKISKKQIGINNSFYNKRWIYNPLTAERSFINTGETLPNGWNYGFGPRNKK